MCLFATHPPQHIPHTLAVPCCVPSVFWSLLQMEMQGDVTSQRRWEAYDKLGTFAIYVIGTILVIQVGRPEC